MSGRIDPAEVLKYLNEMGYTNITALQLKEFIIDLKKLIKYDSRFRKNFDDTAYFAESEYCECSSSELSSISKKSDHKSEKSAVNFLTIKQQKLPVDQQIALHIYDNITNKNIAHEHCIHIKDDYMNQNVSAESVKDKTDKDCSIKSSIKLPSSSGLTKSTSKSKKSKVAFIHPTVSKPSFTKCDPVALYHHYQSVWKKTKIPGEDPRDELRWTIRERMARGAPVPTVGIRSCRPSLRSSSCR